MAQENGWRRRRAAAAIAGNRRRTIEEQGLHSMRMTKWLGALALTATMLSGAALSGGALSTAHAQEIKLRIGHVQSITTPTGQASTLLGTTVKDQTKGAVTVDIFPGAQLGGELEMLSQVRLGSLDMAMLGSGIVAAIEPSFSLTELPYI
jgi:TRAP-type C4-dicarboxylate transport system substrate-binding protein